MTPLPKRKPSRQRQGKRRSSIKLRATSLTHCQKCKSLKRPFTVCPNCGFYNDLEIIKPKTKIQKNEKPA